MPAARPCRVATAVVAFASAVFALAAISTDFNAKLVHPVRPPSASLELDDSFARRKQRLRETCARYADPFRPESAALAALHSDVSQFAHFEVNGAAAMACVIHKVGSNSWTSFLQEAGTTGATRRRRSEDDGDVLPDCWPKCARRRLKLITVRHPFERLLSAWRHVYGTDKLKYGLDRALEWTEFVDHVVAFNTSDASWMRAQASAGSHWEPFWRTCSVCHVDLEPDFIFTMDTLTADLESFLSATGMPAELAEQFPTHVQNHDGHTSHFVSHMYSLLSKEQVRRLYEVYRLDHELFGFSPETYLEYAT